METSDGSAAAAAFFGTGLLIFILFIWVFVGVVGGKIFTKAGKPGWAAFVPIYNAIVFLEIVGSPAWWIILLLIPGLNIIFAIILVHRLSLSFGEGGGFTILMLLIPIIGYPMLAFGGSTYKGPPAS